MINIYPADTEDFSTLGLAVLQPTECTVEEKAGGLMELEMKHPVDDDLKWTYLQNGCIIKAPCAVREAPIVRILDNVPSGATQTVTRAIYKVRTNTGARLRLRAKPSTSAKIIRAYKVGTEVVQLSKSGDWSRVVIKSGGATGWMYSQYLKFDRNETETVKGDNDQPSTVIESKQTRDQLFRIYSVGRDAETGMVEVKASHIFYDLSGVICTRDYKPENVAADTVLSTILASASAEHGFTFHCNVSKTISGDYTGASIVKALLDPDIGIVPQTGARIIRDNYDVYILPDEVMDRGMEIRHRKNLLGAVLTVDVSGVVTRIRPVGKDKDGNRLLITENNGWVESANKGLYPTSRDAEIEYDVSVSTAKDAQFKNNAAARAELKRLAQHDFADGMDAAAVSLDVQLAALENSAEYADYAPLLTVFLYDSVRVVASYVGINAKLRVNGYVYDCLLKRYQDVYVGDISELEQTTYGYEIADGSVSGVKILPGSVNANSVMRNATIGYAKIAQAAIDQLSADSIVAVRAHISKLVAGNITTDQLYVDLAQIAVAQITTANINKANIGWAQIATLSAQIATIAQAQITTANIKNANIDWAQIAVIAAGSITADKLAAGSVTTDKLAAGAVTAEKIASKTITADLIKAKTITADSGIIDDSAIGTAQIADGSITSAKIVELNADLIQTGTLSAERLLLVGEDGVIYKINAASSGLSMTELAKDQYKNYINGTVIVAKSITAAQIAAQSITGNEILAGSVTAKEINVSDLFASEATINELNAMDIRGNKYLQLYVTDKVDGIAVGGRNLLRNTNQGAVNWDWSMQTGGKTIEEYLDGGVRAVKMTRDAVEQTGWSIISYAVSEDTYALLEPNTEYTLSFDYKPSVATANGVMFSIRRGDGTNAATNEGGYWKEIPANKWTHVSGTFTTVENIPDFLLNSTEIYITRLPTTVNSVHIFKNLKLEKGNKATDWSPAPEDPAGSLSVNSDYSKVDINTERVRIVSKRMEVAVPSDDGEDDVLRVDADGVHAEVVEADMIVSDSVVHTQGAASYTPANAGELAAYLEGLSGKCLTGDVDVNCINVSSGSFEVQGLCGAAGKLTLRNGALNALTVRGCGRNVIVYVESMEFSTSGVAVTVDDGAVMLLECSLNAGTGLRLGANWPSEAWLSDCEGDCTTLAALSSFSRLWASGSKPTGTLSLGAGSEVYNATPDPTFETATAPSIPTTQTVTVSLSPTSTSTSGYGSKLYQGRYSSSQSLRKGVMLFTLPSDLTSADKIDSATLTIKRIGGVGQGGGVSVHVRCYDVPGTLYASKTAYENQTVSIDVTSAVKAMKTSGYTGLMLYNPDTTTVGSKSYTASYSRFAGKGESGAPVLKISYRK